MTEGKTWRDRSNIQFLRFAEIDVHGHAILLLRKFPTTSPPRQPCRLSVRKGTIILADIDESP
jgi:hypothetical protein